MASMSADIISGMSLADVFSGARLVAVSVLVVPPSSDASEDEILRITLLMLGKAVHVLHHDVPRNKGPLVYRGAVTKFSSKEEGACSSSAVTYSGLVLIVPSDSLEYMQLKVSAKTLALLGTCTILKSKSARVSSHHACRGDSHFWVDSHSSSLWAVWMQKWTPCSKY